MLVVKLLASWKKFIEAVKDCADEICTVKRE